MTVFAAVSLYEAPKPTRLSIPFFPRATPRGCGTSRCGKKRLKSIT